MALVTVQRELSTKPRLNPSISSDDHTPSLGLDTADTNPGTKYLDEVDAKHDVDVEQCVKKQRSVSECYFVVKGAALILPHDECMHVYRKSPNVNGGTNDIQNHLKSMFYLLREEDTLRMAVKLESMHPGRARYLVVVSCIGPQNNEESCLLGIDCSNRTTIGLVLPVFADTMITLDGDGGFSVSSSLRHHIFKPVSVQAMWSALQTLHRCSAKARESNYFTTGGSHQWVEYYEKRIESDRSCLNEWHAMDDLVSRRPPSPDSIRSKPTEREATENLIRVKLKEVMMSVDLDEVTSKCIRTSLEEQLDMNLDEYKSFIDQEMLMILGQMDAPTEIFEYLYLGSEWNASNLEELKVKGVDHILNVTREIDNFFPGMFDYLNVRVYDDESTEMLKHWDKTFKYIRKVKSEGSKVLVHCKMGISRSASVVIAYVMKAYDWNFEQALDFVRNKRSCIKPNQGFVKQLEIYQGILDASKQRHNSLWRSKSETNLKIIGIPRHLKKKEFNENLFNSSGDENKSLESNRIFTDELKLPGCISRPKSWSPDDSAVECLFSSSPLLLNKACQFGGQQSTTDPSYYLNLEAGRRIHPLVVVKDDKDSKMVPCPVEAGSTTCGTIARVSSIKNRINELETQGGSLSAQETMQKSPSTKSELTTVKTGTMVVNSKSGLVLNLATQFEAGSKPSTPSPEALSTDQHCETSDNARKSNLTLSSDLTASVVEPVISQTKQPASKHQAILVKPNTYPRDTGNASALSSTSSISSSTTKTENWNYETRPRNFASPDLNQSGSLIYPDSLTQSSMTVNSGGEQSFGGVTVIDTTNFPSILPSQTNVREGFSRQSSSSSCISTPKSVDLPFSWSRQSSCSSPSTISSPPISQRWPKIIGISQSQLNPHNVPKQAEHLDSTPDRQNSVESEPYTDVKAIQQRLMHLEKTHSSVKNECVALNKDIVYDREEIPFTPGTVRRTKQKLESNTLKRTASFDSSFPAHSRSTPSTPPEAIHNEKSSSRQSPVARSKSLRTEHRPRSMAGVFPSNWHATPPATNCAPVPQNLFRQPRTPTENSTKCFKSGRMHHSRSTPSVVEAVNQVLCGTREILNSAIQSLPSQNSHLDISNSLLLNLSKNCLELDLGQPKINPDQRDFCKPSTLASGANLVEAYNSNIKQSSFPCKKNESATSVTLGTIQNKDASTLSSLISPNVSSIVDSDQQVIKNQSSNQLKQNQYFSENSDLKKDLGSNYDCIGQVVEAKLVTKDIGHNLADTETAMISYSVESNSEGVVKRLTKELEAKSGSPSGGRKEKIVIIDKESGSGSKKDASDFVKTNLPILAPKSPLSPCVQGAKSSSSPLPLDTTTSFLRKVRARSDGSETNSLLLDSSSSSLVNSSRRKSSLDMDTITKPTENNSDFNWDVNGQLSEKELGTSSKYSKPPLVVERQTPATTNLTNRITSTGRPPPGAPKAFPLNQAAMSPTSLDTPSQEKKCRKQQGKTHPLSKLTPKQRHPNPLYNTM